MDDKRWKYDHDKNRLRTYNLIRFGVRSTGCSAFRCNFEKMKIMTDHGPLTKMMFCSTSR